MKEREQEKDIQTKIEERRGRREGHREERSLKRMSEEEKVK